MLQQGQVFELATRGRDGKRLWAYRFRAGGRDATRVQRGGFRSETGASGSGASAGEAPPRAQGREKAHPRRVRRRVPRAHEVSPVTLAKLRFLLSRALQAFGDYYLDELDPVEISAWRMTIALATASRRRRRFGRCLPRCVARRRTCRF